MTFLLNLKSNYCSTLARFIRQKKKEECQCRHGRWRIELDEKEVSYDDNTIRPRHQLRLLTPRSFALYRQNKICKNHCRRCLIFCVFPQGQSSNTYVMSSFSPFLEYSLASSCILVIAHPTKCPPLPIEFMLL